MDGIAGKRRPCRIVVGAAVGPGGLDIADFLPLRADAAVGGIAQRRV
jgi:hypothetical protein